MAVNELIVSGKWATGTNWSLGEKPKASHDVLIPAGKEAKIEAAAVCRSLLVEGTVTSTSSLAIGNSEQPNGPAGLNWIWKVAVGATITGWKNGVELASTFTGAEQKISVDKGLTFAGELKNSSTSKGKYLLEEQLNIAGGWASSSGLIFSTNGKIVKTASSIEFPGEKVQITLGVSKLEIGGVWVAPSGAESTLSAASSTIVYTGTKFVGAGLVYGTLVVEGAGAEIQGSNTFATLTLKTAGLTATKFQKGTTQTVEAFKAEGGKAGSLVKMESSEAGKEWKLHKVSGNVNVSFIEVKDSHVDAAPKWYGGAKVTESVFLTGNENWLEEVEPSGKKTQEEAIAIRSGAQATLAAVKVAQAALASITGVRTQANAVRVATTPVSVIAGSRLSLAAQRTVQSAIASRTGARTTITSVRSTQTTLAFTAGARTSQAAVRVATSPVSQQAGARTATTALRVAVAAVSMRTGARIAILAPGNIVSAAVSMSTGARASVTGARVVQAILAGRTGARTATTAVKVTQSPMLLAAGSRVALTTGVVFLAQPSMQAGARTTITARATIAGTSHLLTGARISFVAVVPGVTVFAFSGGGAQTVTYSGGGAQSVVGSGGGSVAVVQSSGGAE